MPHTTKSMSHTINGYTATIGLEVHAELKTATKMFCNSKNDPHAAEPNTHVCPVCMGEPGTLPTVNKEAVKFVLMVGQALGSKLAEYTEFDRKNYFYPDIPKGYQISQYAYPLVSGGELVGVSITRVHLEEDTARSSHEADQTLVDYNRAGVPLMELVTEPVIHDSKTAGTFARELQLLLRILGVSDANMERGEMRVEANISVSKTDEFGTKVEVKNLNSFKSVESAIDYEIKRQIELIEKGGAVIQETRGWDENRDKTFSQRVKESADDYRYFPDPDIPKFQRVEINELSLSRLKELLPILPKELRLKYNDLGLTSEQIETIISSNTLKNLFENATEGSNNEQSKLAANYITTDLPQYLEGEGSVHTKGADMLRSLVGLISTGEVNSRVAKDLLKEAVIEGLDPKKLASERGLIQNSSSNELRKVVVKIISEHTSVVSEYRGGKEASLQFLIGQGMKATKGAANPGVLKEVFLEEINK